MRRTSSVAAHGLRVRGVIWCVVAVFLVACTGGQPGGEGSPTVLGMPMHILVPAVGFYIKHAWVWRSNPAGMFADWNPRVTCP